MTSCDQVVSFWVNCDLTEGSTTDVKLPWDIILRKDGAAKT